MEFFLILMLLPIIALYNSNRGRIKVSLTIMAAFMGLITFNMYTTSNDIWPLNLVMAICTGIIAVMLITTVLRLVRDERKNGRQFN